MSERDSNYPAKDWVITVMGGYGEFLFHGSEVEAEDMRRHKANWERAIARKREATPEDVARLQR